MIKRYFTAIAFTLFFVSVNANSQEKYAWPLKLTPELTSKFCDYRAGHFHSGLDIRTGGKIGVPVYAVDDGYVWRVAMSFRGYGKALYIKLKDDRLVVYGHLSGFFDRLNENVRNAQIRDKKYSQDLYFKAGEFPVRKGQLVAYSGSTGTGAPHLHLELRSPLNNPINPTNSGFSLPDKNAPRFDYLAIRYYDAVTRPEAIPGDPCDIEYIPVNHKPGTNDYSIADTIIGDGFMALAVTGGDLLAGPGFLYSYYGLKLSIDGNQIFEMDSDSLSYNTTRQLNYVRDLELIRAFADKKKTDNDANIFYRVYIPPNATQFFWSKSGGKTGVIPPGEPGVTRKAVITAYDEFQNSSRLTLFIRTPELNSGDLKLISVDRRKDSLVVVCDSPNVIRKITADYRTKEDMPFRRITARFISLSGGVAGKQRYRIAFPGNAGEYRFRAIDNRGMTGNWQHFRDDNRIRKLKIFGSPDKLVLEYLSSISGANSTLAVKNHDQSFSMDLTPYGPGLFRAEIIGKRLAGITRFSIMENDKVVGDTQLVLSPVFPGSAAEIKSPDSTLTIEFQSNSAFYPAYVFTEAASRESLKQGPAIVFNVQPDNFLANQNIKYRVDAAKLALIGKKVAIYGYSYTSGGWNFIGRIQGNTLEASGIGLGKLAILEDNLAPVINAITPSQGTKSRTPQLSCTPSDNLSGLALDDGISMSLDGVWVPAEYDIDSGKFRYSVKNPLKPGTHSLEIKAMDNQGNSTTRTTNFKVY
jgi:hypothetical protein